MHFLLLFSVLSLSAPSETTPFPQPTASDALPKQAFPAPSAADTTTPPSNRGVSAGGLLLDETISVVGRTFYEAFYDHWKKPKNISGFTISIREKPLPQFGSRLTVRVDDTRIFQSQFRPGSRELRPAAQRAAERAQYYLRKFYEPRQVY